MDVRGQMDRIYGGMAPEDIPWNRREPPGLLVQLVESRVVTPCEAVDLGCGLGHYTRWLASRGFQVETLAVVAYRQPVTAAEIAEIRGVNTSGGLGTLMERKLVKVAGRKPVVGRPFLYATTREFLMRFGLNDLSDLPKVEDMADVLGFEPPSGLAEAGPSETMLPLDNRPDPDKTLDIDEVPPEPEAGR